MTAKNEYQNEYYRTIAKSWIEDSLWNDAMLMFFRHVSMTDGWEISFDDNELLKKFYYTKLNKFFMNNSTGVKPIYRYQKTRVVFGTHCMDLNGVLFNTKNPSIDFIVSMLKKSKFKSKPVSTKKAKNYEGSGADYYERNKIKVSKERDRSAAWHHVK